MELLFKKVTCVSKLTVNSLTKPFSPNAIHSHTSTLNGIVLKVWPLYHHPT